MAYWIVVTSPNNFKFDKEHLNFKTQGIPLRSKKSLQAMNIGDKVIYYIMGLQKFGAIASITGEYYEDKSILWPDNNEIWPARRYSKPDIVLEDDELIDAKKLVPDLTFITNKEYWGVYFQGSIRQIPEDDYRLIESEMRKVIVDRHETKVFNNTKTEKKIKEKKTTENEYEQNILSLPLQTKTLHDRLGEMIEQIGSWLEYNTQTRHKITPDHPYQLDVAWLDGKNPEIAIEVQISGNLTEAKDRLAQARKFNYRKVIIVIKESDMERMNSLLKHEPDLRYWMEAWSIGAVYEMYTSGQRFYNYFKKFTEAVYKEKNELHLVE